MRTAIRLRAKPIVTSLSRDIYSNRPKNSIIIKFSLCVTHVLEWFHNKCKFVEEIQRWKGYLQIQWVKPP